MLIVSEPVTGAVTHAEGSCALKAGVEEGRTGVAVGDGAADLPDRQDLAETSAESGQGLKVLRALGPGLFADPSDGGKQIVEVLTR